MRELRFSVAVMENEKDVLSSDVWSELMRVVQRSEPKLK